MPIISGAKGGITVRDLLQIGPAVFRSWMEDKNVADLIDSIRQAKKLRDAGVLTEKESQERIAQLKKDRVDKLELNRQLYEHLQKEYSEKKARLKRLLPYVTYMARFINNIRKNENAIPTGLYIMDYDHVPDPEAIYNAFIKGREGELAIALVHITPSGEGLRIVACTPQRMTIAEAQAWLAEQLGLMDYDKVVRDLARASFMPRKEDLLYYDEELLFCEDLEAELARRGIVLPTGQPEEAPVTPVEAETAAATTAEPSGSTQTYPDTFQGEPYADIAHRCLTANGKKEPVVGERHQRLLWLAELLRYICGNNMYWMLQIMPTYGLPLEEMKGIVEWACAQPLRPQRPKVLEQALRPRPEEEELPELPKKLPGLIRLVGMNTPDFQKAAVSQGVFSPLATHPNQVYFPYIDGKWTGLGQMTLLVASSSSGKSCVNTPIDYIMADIRARDEENRRIEQAWKDEVNTKGANKDKSKRPKTCVQWMEPDMTNAALVQRLMDAEGRFIYLRMDELKMFDALKDNTKTESQHNIICLAFDESPYGQERAGTMSVSGRPKLRLNLNASTTPRQAKLYFRDKLIDGPLTRICFCTIPDQGIGADIPVYGTYGEAFAARLRPYIENLNSVSPGRMECPEAFELAKRLNAECQERAKKTQSRAYDSFRKRAVLIAYRKACLLWLANGQRWEPEIEDFVRWSLQYDLACKMRFFGREVELALALEAAETPVSSSGHKRSDMLARLPQEFTFDDLVRARQDEGQSAEGTMDQLKQWKKRGNVEVVTGDTYKTATFRKCI